MKTLIAAVEDADSVEIDCAWCVLRDFKIGILKKVKCWALIFALDEDQVIAEAPKDENGRILDKQTRTIFHDSLLKVSQKQNN